MTDDIDVLQRSRRHYAEIVGLGRSTNRTLRALALVGVAYGTIASVWAWREARVSADRVERYVIYLDAQSQPVGKLVIGAGWTPQAGTYMDFARRWILYLRSRPQDIEALKYQRGEVIKATDPQLYQQLGETMKAADLQVRTAAVDVSDLSVNLVKHEAARALVAVRWTEQVRQAGAKPSTWSAILTIIYVEPKVRGQFERNLLGLYAIEFQATQES